jgi:hypothetical protein
MASTSDSTRAYLLGALVAVGGGVLIWLATRSTSERETESQVTSAKAADVRPELALPGDIILRGYASPESTPEQDLEAVANAFGNLKLLVKGSDPFRMGANEEFAAALLGRNRTNLPFLSEDHPAINARGQIVDRWGQPLFFHVESTDRIDVRSAGPDGRMWTDDDLQRQHDGRIHRGDSLPPDDPGR